MKKNESKFKLWNLFLSVLAIVLFSGIVVIYYIMLYNSTKENIINSGKTNAISSSEQINKHLSTSTDILRLAAYTLDNMIRDNRSGSEILDYLYNQTIAAQDGLVVDTTGLYGYIYGEYMDGANWVPDEDYVPTQRPWYIQARANNGRITIVDPYIDSETGTVTITVAKTLCDAKSVVGIDFSMEKLQSITEEHVENNENFSEIIVNEKGKIIAYSDRSKLGINLAEKSNSLEGRIAANIDSYSEEGNFYLDYNNRDYIVYVMPLDNGWTDISIIDATRDFKALLAPLLFTIIVAVIMIAILLFYMISSEKKEKETRLLQSETTRAMEANEAKTAFLSNMSHEIRTPINVILSMNEMIQRECTEEDIVNYSNNIQTAGATLLSLVNDVLDFSKIEAGKMDILPVNYSPASLVNDLMNLFKSRAEAKGLALIGDFDKSIPSELRGDEIRVKQVITNLLSNAVKYTHSGSITFKIGHEKTEDEKVISLNVSVIDTGIGIKTEDINRLFNKFDRIEEKRNRNIQGTGLGLNITQTLLKMMGSELKVESTYGKGSCFSFELKQEIVSAIPIGDYSLANNNNRRRRKRRTSRFTAEGAKILIVDDTPINIDVFCNLLKNSKLRIDKALSGDEAVNMTLANKYDMIFLDHMMPGKDGIETLREIKGNSSNPNARTPSVCLTANAVSGAKEKYMSVGFDEYLSKPIDSDLLEDMLINYLPKDKLKVNKDSKKEENDVRLPDFLYGLKEIDIKKGIENCGSNEDYISTLKNFARMIGDNIEFTENCISTENYKDAVIKIHAMKSTSRVIGALEIGNFAQDLESAGKTGDIETLKNDAPVLFERLRKLKEDLSTILEDGEKTGDLRTVSQEELSEIYKQISVNLSDWNIDRALELVEGLKNCSVPENEAERVKAVGRAADNFDYEKIAELLKS